MSTSLTTVGGGKSFKINGENIPLGAIKPVYDSVNAKVKFNNIYQDKAIMQWVNVSDITMDGVGGDITDVQDWVDANCY